MESRPSGGGNFIGVMFIVLILLGIGIAATTGDFQAPGQPVGLLPGEAEVVIPDTGGAQMGELQGQVNLEAAPEAAPAEGKLPLQECIVQSGDTLGIIADRHGVTVAEILALNPQVTDPNLIIPGQALWLPHETVALPSQPAPGELSGEVILPSTGGLIYTVQPGDTLSGISLRYNKSTAEILLANPTLTNPNVLAVGQQIIIPD